MSSRRGSFPNYPWETSVGGKVGKVPNVTFHYSHSLPKAKFDSQPDLVGGQPTEYRYKLVCLPWDHEGNSVYVQQERWYQYTDENIANAVEIDLKESIKMLVNTEMNKVKS